MSVTPGAIAERWSGLEEIGWEGTIDGAPFIVERGRAGDYRFVHGEHPRQNGDPSAGTRAVHHLSADMRLLGCSPVDPSDVAWWRVVLDSVLFTVALLRGYEALHAAAVALPEDGAIAIAAPMGGGKSTLLSELLLRGLTLMADDVLVLETSGDAKAPLAHPAPPVMTVPNPRTAMLAELEDVPDTICSLEDERWIAVHAHPGPLPLRALVILDRRPGYPLSLTKIEDPLAPLMSSLMAFPTTQQRQRARFELASVLSDTTILLRLTADSSTSVEILVDTLLSGLEAMKGQAP